MCIFVRRFVHFVLLKVWQLWIPADMKTCVQLKLETNHENNHFAMVPPPFSPSDSPRTESAASTSKITSSFGKKSGVASVEHQRLAQTIKQVHKQLRADTQRLGARRAWAEHLRNGAQLRHYSQAMQTLATRFWDPNTSTRSGQRTRSSPCTEHNRIAWSVRFCGEYFGACGGGGADAPNLMLLQRERERRIADVMADGDDDVEPNQPNDDDVWTPPAASAKLRLLDVGSCYNPFDRYENFDVTAIDIAPAADSAVQQCDFLALRIGNGSSTSSPATDSAGSLTHLPACHFDVVVFSLLLEYMPTSEQRLQCCRNAYELLRPEGVLIVITPDSCHVGANARLLKTWRYALSLMGFSRVRFEKLQHLSCMAFRRSPSRRVAQRWARMHREDYMSEAMPIPQDVSDGGNATSEMSGEGKCIESESANAANGNVDSTCGF